MYVHAFKDIIIIHISNFKIYFELLILILNDMMLINEILPVVFITHKIDNFSTVNERVHILPYANILVPLNTSCFLVDTFNMYHRDFVTLNCSGINIGFQIHNSKRNINTIIHG